MWGGVGFPNFQIDQNAAGPHADRRGVPHFDRFENLGGAVDNRLFIVLHLILIYMYIYIYDLIYYILYIICYIYNIIYIY